ncbi:hypothetical protein ABIE78_003096 [Sinorhizobium fredii]|uniref:Uncharacterized protein n=1 Tax=Sinorhizobium fredii (strain USDA 257) TaxID=1185652 RepID=I3X5E1_SINF2|nr:hypothetical protein [Sinorhizobium fredii]AFL51097.1 hypothetical protein USDA257_c25210 [Sinorhizobium fredii USDA 257]
MSDVALIRLIAPFLSWFQWGANRYIDAKGEDGLSLSMREGL